jgi:hypothetical protein
VGFRGVPQEKKHVELDHELDDELDLKKHINVTNLNVWAPENNSCQCRVWQNIIVTNHVADQKRRINRTHYDRDIQFNEVTKYN